MPPPRFLEIGHVALVKVRYPAETEYINTEFATVDGQGRTLGRLWTVVGQAVRLVRAAFGGTRYDLVVCRCFGRFIWRRDIPWPLNLLRWAMGEFIRLCVWRQTARGAALAVVDLLDEATIAARDLFLLQRCRLYFKRELPQNAWDAFLRVQPAHGEYYLMTCDPRWRARLGRLRPFTLGLAGPPRLEALRDARPPTPVAEEKFLDVFYAGAIAHSTVRMRGFPLLAELGRRGLRVEAMDTYISHEEFLKRVRGAWLVWSPAGQGWDCYRHYEVCLAGSVPLINQPTIQRYQPLVEGVHCVYYYSEGEDLCRRAEAALADKPALLRMAAAAREHVLQNHLPGALGAHVVHETLAAAGAPAGE